MMEEHKELTREDSDEVFDLIKGLHGFGEILLDISTIPDEWFEATGSPNEYKRAYREAVSAMKSLIDYRPTPAEVFPELASYPESERPHYMVFLSGIKQEVLRIRVIEDTCFQAFVKKKGLTKEDPERDFSQLIKVIQDDDEIAFIHNELSTIQVYDRPISINNYESPNIYDLAYCKYYDYLQEQKKSISTYFEWQDLPEYCERINDIINQKWSKAGSEIARLRATQYLKIIETITFSAANEHRKKQRGISLKESFSSYIWDILNLPDNTAVDWRNRFFATQLESYGDQITAAVDAKVDEFIKQRNNRKEAPTVTKAISKRTGLPETGVYIMQGQGLDDFIRQTGPADVPIMAYMISNKSSFDEAYNLLTAPLADYLTLTERKDTPETRRSIRESIKRLRQIEYSLEDSDGSGSGIDFSFGSETRVTRNGNIQLQLSDRAAIIIKKCRLPLDIPAFLYRLPSHDRYTFKMWYKMASDIYINMGKAEVAAKSQKKRIENRLGRLSVRKICEYIGLETDLPQSKYFRQSLFTPFNKALETLASNNAISYSFAHPSEKQPISMEEYNNISYSQWCSLILCFEMPVNQHALEGKIKSLQKNGNAERAKQARQAKKSKTKVNSQKKEKPNKIEPEPEKVFSGVTQGLFDENDE